MRVDQFDFLLPEERIALRPARPRDSSRLYYARAQGEDAHHHFTDLPQLLRRGDLIIFNDTKVIPAQLEGRRGEAKVGVTLHMAEGEGSFPRRWRAFIRNAKRVRPGDIIILQKGVSARAVMRHEDGSFTIEFEGDEPLGDILARAGMMPLPPYIASKRAIDAHDAKDYQTIFAKKEGAVAAPTASLHFTSRVLSGLADAGVQSTKITLHVGAGTFLPVKVDDVRGHKMHHERGVIDAYTADLINDCRSKNGRIIAVGTTVLRLLESAADASGMVHPFTGSTDIFITPGYKFKVVDGLITNFHLPRSTLFMLVSALMGRERMLEIYEKAIVHKYRFYSYGDSSLLIP